MPPKRRSCEAEAASAEAEAAPAAKKPKAAPKEAPTPRPKQGGPLAHYLLKSEPDEYSVDQLAAAGAGGADWDGVRNFQARNILEGMRRGDQCFFYHSSCKVPAIVGIAEVVSEEAYPDVTAVDPSSEQYDPKSNPSKRKWVAVRVRLVRKLGRPIPLGELKEHKEGALSGMVLLRAGRLSCQPVSRAEWDFILALEGSGEG